MLTEDEAHKVIHIRLEAADNYLFSVQQLCQSQGADIKMASPMCPICGLTVEIGSRRNPA